MPQAVTAGVVYLMNAGLSMAAAQVVVYGSMAIAAGYTTVKTAEAKARRAENAARRKAANRAQEIQNMQFGTVAPRRFIYGQTITNGHLVFQETAGTDNKDLYRVLYLGEAPIQSADQLFFNEEEITALSGTLDSTAGASVNSGTYNGYLDVQVGKNGGAGANVPTSLTSKLASNTSWTSNHKMTGNSWLAYKVVHNNEVWTSGVPNVRVRVNGRRVYDPRLDGTNGGSGSHRYNDETTWAYSNNSALCVLDFLINGMKVEIDDLDIASFQAAASTCDDNITIINSSGTSTTEKRYTTNGVAFLDEEVITTLEELLIPCHGSLIEEGGTIRLLVPGASTTVTANLTEDDLISELSIKVNAQISSRMNKVGGSFTSAEENYQEVDFSPISSSALIADDGREHIQEISLTMVTSESHAQRIASIVLKENALTNSINVTLKPEFAYLRVGDIVTLTFQPEVIGGTGSDSILTNATKFQVVSYSLQPSGEIAVELQEYNDSSYVWNTADHDYVTRTDLADSFIEAIPQPTFGSPTQANYLDENGNQILAFSVPITHGSHPNFAFTSVALSRFGVRANNTETPIDLVEGLRAGLSDTDLKFSNLSTQLEPGHVGTYVSYNYKLFGTTYVENGKRSSPVGLDVTSSIAKDTTAPSQPTSLSATGGLNQITLKWANPTDLDFDRVAVYRHTSNAVNSAVFIGDVRGTSFVDTGISNSTQRYYWITSVDKVGNESAKVGQVNATTDSAPPAGSPGNNTATVELFRAGGASAPTQNPSGNFTYTFSTGALSSGTLNGWSQTIPALSVGQYLWKKIATATSNNATVTIAASSFSTPRSVGRIPERPTVSLGTVSTGSEGSSASGTNTGTGEDSVFNFTIPVGATGDSGLIITLNGADIVTNNHRPTQATNAQLSSAFTQVNPALLGSMANVPDDVYVFARFIDAGSNATAAGSLVSGRNYEIFRLGTTDFTAAGAVKNQIGVTFTHNGASLSGTGSCIEYSVRQWNYSTQSWSSHVTDFAAPAIFSPEVLSQEMITNFLAASVIEADQLIINSEVDLEDGAAWRVGKNSFDSSNDGIFLGNPTGNLNFAFATTGTNSSNEKHGVEITDETTKIINPLIVKEAQNSFSSSNIQVTGNYTIKSSTVNPNAVSLVVNSVGGGAGGAGAVSQANAPTNGGTTRFRLILNNSTQSYIDATGGTARTGTGSDKWRGDPGDASAYASGAAYIDSSSGGNGTNNAGTLGSGGAGGSGRPPDWNTSSRKGGAGGGAGQHVTSTFDISSYSTVTLQIVQMGSGGSGGTSNRGQGGNGGTGLVQYTIDTNGPEEVTLLADAEYKAGTVGRFQSWQSITVAQNVWVANPDDQPVQVCISQGVAGGGSSFFQIADDANGTNAISITQKDDDNARELMAACIVPVGKYFRQTNHGSYLAAILRT